MSQTTLKVSFEGVDPAQAGLYAQELRNQILDSVGQGANVSLQGKNPESMQFYDTVWIDLLAPNGFLGCQCNFP
jgi:hypothetical protein